MSLWHPRYRFSCLFFFLGLILWLPLNLHTSRSEPNSGQVCHEACMGRAQARFSRSDCGRYKMKYIHRIFVYLYTILYMSIYKETNGGFILLHFLSFACSFDANSLRNSHSFVFDSLPPYLRFFLWPPRHNHRLHRRPHYTHPYNIILWQIEFKEDDPLSNILARRIRRRM